MYTIVKTLKNCQQHGSNDNIDHYRSSRTSGGAGCRVDDLF